MSAQEAAVTEKVSQHMREQCCPLPLIYHPISLLLPPFITPADAFHHLTTQVPAGARKDRGAARCRRGGAAAGAAAAMHGVCLLCDAAAGARGGDGSRSCARGGQLDAGTRPAAAVK